MPTTTVGREYLRVSRDRSGKMRSPAEQHDDNQAAADASGWTLGAAYREPVAVSASRYATKAREEFNRLLGDIEGGRFGARVLILWENSRGSRLVSEWARLIDACEAQGVLIHVTSHGHTYDPANYRDRRSLQEDAVDSEYESAKTSKRILRDFEAAAKAGLPHGRCPYGYTRTYDPVTRAATQVPHPEQAPVVRELFARLQAGDSLKAIARDFEKRGIVNGKGGPFSAPHLRDIALRPAYAGLRLHRPGKGNKHRTGSVADGVQAKWPALVDRETFDAVRALLQNAGRRTARSNRASHMLSLIAVCGHCDAPLTSTKRNGYWELRCRGRSCVRIAETALDELAEKVMIAYLSQPGVVKRLRSGGGDSAELAQARTELTAARAELAALRQAARLGRMSVATVVDMEPGLLARLEFCELRERELSTPPALLALLAPGADLAARWAAAELPARREAARILCSPAVLGQLRLHRLPAPGQRVPAEERVEWRRG